MQELGDADADADGGGELENMMDIGRGYLLRVLDVPKPGRIIEIEMEVLGLKSSNLLQSECGKRYANDCCE